MPGSRYIRNTSFDILTPQNDQTHSKNSSAFASALGLSRKHETRLPLAPTIIFHKKLKIKRI